MASRRRCVPASGAKVRPVFLPFCRKVVGAQTRERKIHMTLCAELLQIVAELNERAEIRGRERGERHLLVAGILDGLLGVFDQQLFRAVAHGAVDIARLAEAAAADAAAKQLERGAVLHDLGGGPDGLGGIPCLVHVAHDALGNDLRRAVLRRDRLHCAVSVVVHLVETGNINAVQLRGGTEKLLLRPALAPRPAVQLDQLGVHLLALADLGNVNKIRDRLTVEHRRAARDDERGQLRALARVERHARQIEHIQHGGKRHLVADGKGDDVEIADGITGLERIERQAGTAHLLLHVAPGGENTLAPDAFHVVHNAVEDPHTEVRHTDLIGVREAEGHTGIHLREVLHHRIVLAAHIARRLLHAGQDAFQSFVHRQAPFLSRDIDRILHAFCAARKPQLAQRSPEKAEGSKSKEPSAVQSQRELESQRAQRKRAGKADRRGDTLPRGRPEKEGQGKAERPRAVERNDRQEVEGREHKVRSGKDKAPLPPRPQAEERKENGAEKVDCHPRERDDQLAPIGEPREGGSVQLRAERCKAEVLDGYAVVAHGGKMPQLVQHRGSQDRRNDREWRNDGGEQHEQPPEVP